MPRKTQSTTSNRRQRSPGRTAVAVRPTPAERRARERLLLEITSLPTAAGREDRVVAAVEAWVRRRARRLVLTRDRFGNLLVARRDFATTCRRGAKPLLITAHLDHPAFVVTGIRRTGARAELDLEFRGGVQDPYFKGASIEVFDLDGRRSAPARIESLDATIEHPAKPFKTVVARMPAARLPKGAGVGSIARWRFPKASISKGLVHTHACDDLAALVAALVAFDSISRRKECANTALLFTRSEEIGFIGAIGAARGRFIPRGARLVCLENSRSFPHDSPIGGGPIVRVGDRLSVFSPTLTNRISDLAAAHAKENPGFRHQRKLMPGGACEATAFAAYGIESTCVCLPLGNYHNMHDIDGVAAGRTRARVARESISVDDFHWLVELLEVTARRIDDPATAGGHRTLMETLWSRHARIVGGR